MPLIIDMSEVTQMFIDMAQRAAFSSDYFFTNVANQLESEIFRSFELEGPGWRELAPATIKNRVRLGYPGAHPIGVMSGRMRDDWHNARMEAMPGQVTLYSENKIAGYFHGGTTRQVSRDVDLHDEAFLNEMAESVAVYVVTGRFDFGFAA